MAVPSHIKIAFLGDVVGMPGMIAIRQAIPILQKRYAPNLIIANAENAANGTGLTPELYKKLTDAGVDAITLGDHVFKKQQILQTLERNDNITRPANISPHATGKRWMRLTPHAPDATTEMPSVYVITVLGRVMMPNMPANDPFVALDQIISELPESDPLVIVEVHAETSSEKQALGWYLNGRVAAVLGTHTHVPTADARILPAQVQGEKLPPNRTPGTAYITDLGMCGPYDSVLGRRVDRVLQHMTTNMYAAFDVAEDNARVCGVILTLDTKTKRCTDIEAFNFKPESEA